ncbi:MAG: ABC transporter substrate-binding protein [Eubacteriales bacterium]|nr:ABC transporter substrate-binding protein [Eubacteriales bacterium]
MKKKVLAMLLTTALATSLGAGAITASADEDVKKVILSFYTWTGAPTDTEMVQEAMNEITREKLGIEVELQISDFASYQQNMTLALSAGEQIDIMANLSSTYANFAQQGYLMDLNEDDLLSTYGQGIIEALGQENIDACEIGGVLYGLPNNRDWAQGRGCAAIARQYLEGIGYEIDDSVEIMRITLDELNEIYEQLHEAYPDKEVYRPTTTSMNQFSNVDALGGNVFGVLLNNGESLTVENLFTSDFYKEYCARMYEYNQKGYISQDAATDTTAVGELVKAGSVMTYTTGGKPGIKVQETGLSGQDMVIFQTMDNYISSTSLAGFPWAIPINTEDAEVAMTYLNELYTNADLMNLLAWGIEGVHYVVNEDGLATFPEGVDATNSGYYHSMGWELPNQFLTYVWEGNNPDLWEEMKEFNNSAVVSSASGFTFNSENVLNQITAVQNIYNEYQASIELGFVDPETAIPEMNDKMMAAGLQDIIDEKQAQLDEWAATK